MASSICDGVAAAVLAAVVLVVSVDAPASQRARPIDRATGSTVPLADIDVRDAAAAFDLDPGLLYAVLALEAGRVGECLANMDKEGTVRSWDCGPFGVNDQHCAKLAPIFRTDPETLRRRLRDDGRFNALIAAYLLADAVQRGDPGAYHSPETVRAARYRKRLHDQYIRMSPVIR